MGTSGYDHQPFCRLYRKGGVVHDKILMFFAIVHIGKRGFLRLEIIEPGDFSQKVDVVRDLTGPAGQDQLEVFRHFLSAVQDAVVLARRPAPVCQNS